MKTETFHPQPGDAHFVFLCRVEREIEARGFILGPLQGDAPRGIAPAGDYVAKWRNISVEERKGLTGRMEFVGRPRNPTAIVVRWNVS